MEKIMKVSKLISMLEKIRDKSGDVEVLMEDGNEGTLWSIEKVKFETVKNDDDYPEHYDMPKGFKFIHLHN